MKLFIVAILIVLSAISASANTFEADLGLSGNGSDYQVILEQPLAHEKQLGVFVCADMCKNWNEIYVGPELNGSINKINYQLAYGIGTETADDNFRQGGWLWIGYGKTSAIVLYEDGGSGPWKKFEGKYAISNKVKLGYVTKSFAGSGPLVEYKLSKTYRVKLSKFDKTEVLAITADF